MKIEDVQLGQIVHIDLSNGMHYGIPVNLILVDLLVISVDRTPGAVNNVAITPDLNDAFSNMHMYISADALTLSQISIPIPTQSIVSINGGAGLLVVNNRTPIVFDDPVQYVAPLKKCECGAESLGYMTHSTWCAKHEK